MPHSLVASFLDPSTADAPTAIAAPPGEPEAPADLAEAHVSDATALDGVRLDAARTLPEGIATLVVQMDGDEAFTLLGRHPAEDRLPSLPLGQRTRPRIAFADVTDGTRGSAARVVRDTWRWSCSTPMLQNWLNRIAQCGGQLVIDDESGFEIPWEMITLGDEHDGGGGEDRYLGAVLPVTRTLPGAGGTDDTSEAPAPSGRVVAYVADEFEGAEDDIGSLRALMDVEPMATMDDLAVRLRAGAGGCSLVYIACHGIHSDDDVAEDVALGSKRDLGQMEYAGERIGLAELDYDLRHVRLRSAVFVNACHSARLLRDSLLGAEVFEGFPDVFLSRGSPGVIGTVGAVSSTFAAAFGATLLAEALAAPGVPIPELLRRRRAATVADAGDGSSVGHAQRVWAFMYVYYGNPSCTLSLQPAP